MTEDEHPDAPDDEIRFERPERPALADTPGTPGEPRERRGRQPRERAGDRRDEPPADEDDRPAPVVTESGTFGTLPEDEPLPDLGDDGWLRAIVVRVAAAALLVVAATWLLVLSAHHVTSRAVAVPALERGVAALTEVDALLTMHNEAIVAAGASRAGEPDARIEVPGFPIRSATLTAAEARDLPPAEQRPLVLGRAATAVYEQGVDAFLVEGGEPVGHGLLSTEGFARRLLATLGTSTHERVGGWLRVIGAAAVALAIAIMLLGRGFGRFGVLAVPLAGAAAVGVATALALRLAAALFGGDGDFAAELSAIAQSLAWTPARNALWFAIAAAAVALPAIIASVFFPEREEMLVAVRPESRPPAADVEQLGRTGDEAAADHADDD